jgi:hypothetical protein
MSDEPKVYVPPADYRVPPVAMEYRAVIGVLLQEARRELGDDLAFSVFLSRVMRELRVVGGPKVADILRGFADTMEEAANLDVLVSILGQRSYEEFLKLQPRDDHGNLRPVWDKLPPLLQETWYRATQPGDPEYR